MAGFWIKMENNLASKPEVVMLAANFDCDEDLIVGKLHRLWTWFDDHTEDGKCNQITTSWIDRFTRLDGFSQALIDCGWLIVENGVIEIPNWDNHNSDTAKRRAKDSKRKGKKTLENKGETDGSAKVPDSFRKSSAKVPRERGKKVEETKNRAEQSRADTEQKNKTPPNPLKGEAADLLETEKEFVAQWNSLEGVTKNLGETLNAKRRKAFRARLSGAPWPWRDALLKFPLACTRGDPEGWKPDMDWILKPDSVQKVIEGKYDWTKDKNRTGGGVDRSLEARKREAEQNGTVGQF